MVIMVIMIMKTTTIAVSTEVKETLDSLGSKGETYNELISKLICAVEKSEFFDRQKSILDSERFVSIDNL